MNIYTKYDKKSGRINGQVVGRVDVQDTEVEGYIEGSWDPRDYCVVDEHIVPLKNMNLGVNGRKIEGIPANSTIHFREEKITVSGAWEAPGRGADVVIITCDRYRPATVKLVDYVALRADEYPAIGDQLDAIWKTLSKSKTLAPETHEMLKNIEAVKAKHPKK